jgi:rubrerythrin
LYQLEKSKIRRSKMSESTIEERGEYYCRNCFNFFIFEEDDDYIDCPNCGATERFTFVSRLEKEE